MRISTGATITATFLAITISAVGAVFGANLWVAAITGLVLGSVPLWPASRNESVAETILARWHYRRRGARRGTNLLFDQDSAGTTWSHGKCSVYVQIDPQPFALTVIDPVDLDAVDTAPVDHRPPADEVHASADLDGPLGAAPSEQPWDQDAYQESIQYVPPATDIVDTSDMLAVVASEQARQPLGAATDPDPALGGGLADVANANEITAVLDLRDLDSDPGSGPDGAENPDGAEDSDDAEDSDTDSPARRTAATLPLSVLAEYLDRSGVHVDSLRVITNGYLSLEESRLATDYLNQIPDAPRPPINQATVIEVVIDVRDSMDAIAARMLEDSPEAFARATSRTAYVVAARLLRALARHRIRSHILTVEQVRDFHDRALDTLNDAIAAEEPRHSTSDTDTTVTYIPRRLDQYALIDSYTYGSTITSTWDVRGTGTADAVVDTALTITAPDLERAAPPPAGHWYPPRYRQGDLQTRALPMADTVDSAGTRTHQLTPELDTAIYLHGPGIHLGPTPDGAALFVNLEPAGRTLWMFGGTWHLSSLIARLSLAGIAVNVEVEALRSYVQALDSDWVNYDTPLDTPGVRIVAAGPDQPPPPADPNTTLIAYSPSWRPEAAPYMLYAQNKDGDFTIKSMSDEEHFHWELTDAEWDHLTAADELATQTV
ncbi:hypothetical protein MUG78_17120 [Gordonia alkaliphila]|uniref:hypothetical protein n=1 Tax=Gordonia alkaliphila TaxID=1053547 RepID=UPI001FF56CD2|nr:hypothetical protein [Gordonia alkaliphila]MCK0441123.1 hypothetical protein [Gordonia alkaliphila]